MKTLFKYIVAALPLLGLTACSSDEDAKTSPAGKATAELQVELEPAVTKSVFTSLPSFMEFSVYVSDESDGNNNYTVNAVYNSGKTTLSPTVMLDDATRHVYAAYPYTSGPQLNIYTNSSQTDYLYGRAEDANGNLASINRENPKANIRMKHAMALLTFNFKQNAEIGNQENLINSISIGNIATSAYINLQSEGYTVQSSGSYTVEVGRYVNTSNAVTKQVLVCPYYSYKPSLTVYVNNTANYLTLPTSIEKGKSYTYDVDVYTAGRLSISNVTIEPRVFGATQDLDGDAAVMPTK